MSQSDSTPPSPRKRIRKPSYPRSAALLGLSVLVSASVAPLVACMGAPPTPYGPRSATPRSSCTIPERPATTTENRQYAKPPAAGSASASATTPPGPPTAVPTDIPPAGAPMMPIAPGPKTQK